MPKQQKETMKSIKISALTHASLMLMSDLFDSTVSEVIYKMIEETHPEVIEEAEKFLRYQDTVRQNLREKQKSNKQ